jgi:hypothetical protein
MNSTSVITLMPSNKEQITTFVNNAKDLILSGNENPLKIAVQLKAMEDTIKHLRGDNDIKEAILKEAEKEGKSFQRYGARFDIKENGVIYDYTECQDTEWNDLKTKYDEIEKKIKEREKFLKVISKPIADAENGNLIYPPSKKSTTSVSVTLF